MRMDEASLSSLSRREITQMIAGLRRERRMLDDVIAAVARLGGSSAVKRDAAAWRLCRQCRQVKPASEFHRNGRYLMSLCRECNTARCAEYYRQNRERLNELRRQRRMPSAVS
jgi:hypothetical protein